LPLVEQFQFGLDAPICLTWELTYACNLACRHCLSSSGRRDPRELSTAECQAVIDELERMQVFYVNIGGGEPTVRPDFWELVDYATAHHVGVKFSTNGVKITPAVARRLAASDYVDVQISLDGVTAEVNDAVRGAGSYATALAAMRNLADAGFAGFKISVVITRHNAGQLDAFKELADRFGAQLRLTRLRPSGRGADVWDELHPTAQQQRELYDWLVARGEQVLTGDSFFHLAAFGESLPGLNLPVRRGPGGLPDRSRRRRVRLPVRHPRQLPGRQRPRPRRVRRRVAAGAAVRRAAPAPGRRCMHVLLGLRLLPRRMHGGQVLHRPAARWPRPRMRQGARCAGDARARRRACAPADRGPFAPDGPGPARPASRPRAGVHRAAAALHGRRDPRARSRL
jgi:mycofactocin radical SAM maturase